MQKCSCVMQQRTQQQQRTLPADTAADTVGADSLKLGTRSRGCGLNWLLNRKPEISSPAESVAVPCVQSEAGVSLQSLQRARAAGQEEPHISSPASKRQQSAAELRQIRSKQQQEHRPSSRNS